MDTKCDTRVEDARVNENELSIGITFHHLGLIVAAGTGLVAVALAEYLIFQHAIHYLKPWEQKHIIRILFMIPVYSAVSFLSYYYYHHAIYFQVLRDCYEAFAIASFFTLLCNYIATNLHDQKEFFRSSIPKNWIWPMSWLQKCTGGPTKGILRKPASGLTWFNIIHVCVFQYCFIRVFFTIVSVIAQVTGRYCEDSLSPVFAHIWVLVFEGASVSVAMYGLIQFYVQLKPDIAHHKPFLKLACIKLVIFFCFWQNLVISFLSSKSGPLRPTKYLSWPDINVGLPSVLVTCEMMIFAILHLFAFPWRKPYGQPHKHSTESETLHGPYSDDSGASPRYQGGFLGVKAILDAFNPWDIIKASARGFRWLFVGARRRREDISYQQPKSKQDTDTPFGGGGGAEMYGYTPQQATSLDSMKLQPITGYYQMPKSAARSTEDSASYGSASLNEWDMPTSGPYNHINDEPWHPNPNLNPYQPPYDLSRHSNSPSPASQNRAAYDPQREGDTAGLLRNAGHYGASSNQAYPIADGDNFRHIHPANRQRIEQRNTTTQFRGKNYQDNSSDDDNEGHDYAQQHEDSYAGQQRFSNNSIGVARTTDDATAEQLDIHPAFRKEVEIEKQYQGYGRSYRK